MLNISIYRFRNIVYLDAIQKIKLFVPTKPFIVFQWQANSLRWMSNSSISVV